MINTRSLFPLEITLLLFLTLSGSSFASLPEDYPQESDTKLIERKEAMPLKKLYNHYDTLQAERLSSLTDQPGMPLDDLNHNITHTAVDLIQGIQKESTNHNRGFQLTVATDREILNHPSDLLQSSIALFSHMNNTPKAWEYIEQFLVIHGYEHYKTGATFRMGENALPHERAKKILERLMIESVGPALEDSVQFMRDTLLTKYPTTNSQEGLEGPAYSDQAIKSGVRLMLHRDLGYMHLNLKNYEKANSFFKKYKEASTGEIPENDAVAMAYSIAERKKELKKAKQRRQKANKRQARANAAKIREMEQKKAAKIQKKNVKKSKKRQHQKRKIAAQLKKLLQKERKKTQGLGNFSYNDITLPSYLKKAGLILSSLLSRKRATVFKNARKHS